MFADLPLDQLRGYHPDILLPGDFDDFWAHQLTAARQAGAGDRAEFTPVATPLVAVDVLDVTFPGHGAAPIKGWLQLPHTGSAHTPIIVEYVGYNGGRGDPLDWLSWTSSGYPHFVMDSRGQGGGWRTAETPDIGSSGEPSANGFVTQGLGSAQEHYYTRLMIDAARAIDALRAYAPLYGRRIVTAGMSQGGGLAIAAAHLAGDVAACLADVPFLAHFERAVHITDARPYSELADYCRLRPDDTDRIFTTLRYLDVANHARRVTAPGFFSAGLRDEITPPSTVFAAYQYYAGPKEIAVYPFGGHEDGGSHHHRARLAFLTKYAA